MLAYQYMKDTLPSTNRYVDARNGDYVTQKPATQRQQEEADDIMSEQDFELGKEGDEFSTPDAMDEDSGQGDADESNDELSDEESNVDKKKGENVATNPKVSLYRGVGIKVRFAKEEQNYLMSQLSGGQKALVAETHSDS